MTHLPVRNTRKLSIITPSLNRVEMLKAAVQSVVTQGYSNYEHIVVDGGSTDGTLEFIKTQPQIKFVCGPDRGMYDALNKGLALASGDVIGFLNTDDLYAEGIFKTVMTLFDDANIQAVAGRAEVFFDNVTDASGIKLRYAPEDQSLLESTTISGNYFNAWFFSKKVFDLVGGFNPAYQIAGDRDFMLRVALKNVPFKTVDKLAYLYRSHADSLTFDHSVNKQKLTASELFEISTYYLKSQKLMPTEKRLIVQLHTEASLALASWHEVAGNVTGSVSAIWDCIKYDPYAILKVLRYLVRSLIKQSARAIRQVIKKFTAQS